MVLDEPAVLDLLLSRCMARLEHSAAPFGLLLPVEIRLWWGLMPGQVSPQHRTRAGCEPGCEELLLHPGQGQKSD